MTGLSGVRLDRLELLSDLLERLARAVGVLPLVRRGDLATQARPPVRDYRESEAGHIDPFFEQRLAHREGLRRVADDDGHDRMRAVRDLEAGVRQRLAEVAGVVAEPLDRSGVLAQEPERLERPGGDG